MVIVAIIGAAGVVLAAVIPAILERRSSQTRQDFGSSSQPITVNTTPPRLFLLRTRPTILTVSATLFTLLVIAACCFLLRPNKKLRVGVWQWPGYSPPNVAGKMHLCHEIDPVTVDVKNIREARLRLIRGDVDASVCIVDSHVHTINRGVKSDGGFMRR
jgi:hypothetical protein